MLRQDSRALLASFPMDDHVFFTYVLQSGDSTLSGSFLLALLFSLSLPLSKYVARYLSVREF